MKIRNFIFVLPWTKLQYYFCPITKIQTTITLINTELSIKAFRSERFRRGDDLDIFIKNCERYFGVPQALMEISKYTVAALLYKELQEEYEAEDEKMKEFEERLRKAFSSTSTMMEDMNKAFGYERREDSADIDCK